MLLKRYSNTSATCRSPRFRDPAIVEGLHNRVEFSRPAKLIQCRQFVGVERPEGFEVLIPHQFGPSNVIRQYRQRGRGSELTAQSMLMVILPNLGLVLGCPKHHVQKAGFGQTSRPFNLAQLGARSDKPQKSTTCFSCAFAWLKSV